jgi:rubrerythrin
MVTTSLLGTISNNFELKRTAVLKRLNRSQTEESLVIAFSGESQASNRYNYCAGAARKEGLMQLADIFAQTAAQEEKYAERFFKRAERVAAVPGARS